MPDSVYISSGYGTTRIIVGSMGGPVTEAG